MGRPDERGTLSQCAPLPNTMAKVVWSAGIDHVSGALSKPSKNSQHSCEKMLLATHRTAATTSKDCNRLFLRETPKRSTPVTADEQAQRARFAAISRAVAARGKDMAQTAQDITAFNAQKDQPGGLKTLKAYRWNICAQAYDQNNG